MHQKSRNVILSSSIETLCANLAFFLRQNQSRWSGLLGCPCYDNAIVTFFLLGECLRRDILEQGHLACSWLFLKSFFFQHHKGVFFNSTVISTMNCRIDCLLFQLRESNNYKKWVWKRQDRNLFWTWPKVFVLLPCHHHHHLPRTIKKHHIFFRTF